MPRTADATAIPERLLAAGLDLFLRHGYNGTGIQQVAYQAGVPKGSFYNHFASKEVFGAGIVGLYSLHGLSLWKVRPLQECMALILDQVYAPTARPALSER